MPDTESKSPSRFTLEIVLHAAGATCLMYYVGIVNLDRCPAEPMIPIFMIVLCGIYLLHTAERFLFFCVSETCAKSEGNEVPTGLDCCQLVYSALAFLAGAAWLVVGSVFVYSAAPDLDAAAEDAADFCDSACYWIAFAAVTLFYVLAGVVLLVCGCACCFCLASLKMALAQRVPDANNSRRGEADEVCVEAAEAAASDGPAEAAPMTAGEKEEDHSSSKMSKEAEA